MPDNPYSDRSVGILSACDLRCNGSEHAMALGAGPVRLSWSLRCMHSDASAHGAVQSAYQVRVGASPQFRDGELLWDSEQVASSCTHVVIPAGLTDAAVGRFWWSARVWDGEGRASSWSPSMIAEVGPRSRDDFEGKWIGPHK